MSDARVGVLINARAGALRRDPALADRIRRQLPPECVKQTADVGEIADALLALRKVEADTLFLVGGDGSVGATLTELVRVWPEPRPAVVLTRGGTINTIPLSLGARGRPDQMLERLLAGGRSAETERPLLRVDADGEERFGLIAANGGAARWLEVYNAGPRGRAAAAALVARILAAVPVGGQLARRIFQAYRAELELDGAAIETGITVAGGASVRHVGLGFAPFRTAGMYPDRFHFVWTDASPLRLAAEIPLFAADVYGRRSCLRHEAVKRARIVSEGSEPYTIDGDLFAPTRELRIEAGPLVRFLAP